MSEENVEAVRRHHGAFVSGDRGGALEPLDPEVEFVFPGLFEFPAARGHAELEKAMIVNALAACGGNRAEAARRLNSNRQLLDTKMQRYGLTERSSSENPTQGVGNRDGERSTD